MITYHKMTFGELEEGDAFYFSFAGPFRKGVQNRIHLLGRKGSGVVAHENQLVYYFDWERLVDWEKPEEHWRSFIEKEG